MEYVNLEAFNYNYNQSSITVYKEFTSIIEGSETPREVEIIIGKRERTPRAIEYLVKWVGYPHEKYYTLGARIAFKS